MSCRDLPSSSMALPQAPAVPPTNYLFTPIIVVMIGIVSTAALLLIYHFIVSKYCARSRPSAPTWQQQPPKVSGVEEWVLSLIPIHDYQPGAIHIDQTECAVCLGELEEGEQVRLLPNCQHAFHVQCIDEWFIAHSNCPICRSPIFPTPPPIVFPVITITAVPATEVEGQLTTRSFSRDAAAALTALPYENKLKPVCLGALKRSLSMDCSYVSHRIQLDLAQSSASSSSSRLSKVAGLKTSHSQKRLDRASTMLIRSLSRLRMGNGGTICRSLPT